MTDSFENSLENGSEYSVLLIDLSKAFTALLTDLPKTFNCGTQTCNCKTICL